MIRFGLVGCGQMGARHAEIIAAHPRAELSAVCSARADAARAFAERFDVSRVFETVDALLACDEVDCVLIATRHDSHAEIALAAAAAGKHALIEKPLAMNVADSLRIAEAFERTDRSAGVIFNWRFSPVVREARRQMPAPAVLLGCMMDDRWPDDHWGQDPRTGGGNVISQSCHMLDLLCYLAGSQPVELSAQTANATHPEARYPDQLTASIRFENGAIASWVQGDAGCPPRGSKFQISMFGGGDQTIEIYDRCKTATIRVGRRVEEMRRRGEEGLSIRTARFIDDLLENRPVECDAWDGVRATLLIERAFRAAETSTVARFAWNNGRPTPSTLAAGRLDPKSMATSQVAPTTAQNTAGMVHTC